MSEKIERHHANGFIESIPVLNRRDQFAKAAMQGLLSDSSIPVNSKLIVSEAVRVADVCYRLVVTWCRATSMGRYPATVRSLLSGGQEC